MTRGGGPAEDLLPFDDPALAEAWMEHPAYTISAVGHAQNASVIDALSDAVCPTPTAAVAFVATKASEAAEIAATVRAASRREAEVSSLTASRDAARKMAVILGAACLLLLFVLFVTPT